MATLQSVDPEATIRRADGEEIDLQLLEATVETSRYDEAGSLELEALADAPREELHTVSTILGVAGYTGEDSATVSLDVNGVTVASGTIVDLAVDEEGVVSVSAIDAVRALKAAGVGQEFEMTPAVIAIRDSLQAAGLESVSQGGGTIGQPGYDINVEHDVDQTTAGETEQHYIRKVFTETTCLSALDQICREVGWYWYVDAENVVQVVDELDRPTHELEFVTETTAGLQSPPYRRVVVIGGRHASMAENPDDSGTHLLSNTRVQGIAGSEDPTYRYTDRSLHTPQAAQEVAVSILEEFMEQRATGVVTIVGDPEIRPYDVIEMPAHLGGEQYIVSDIVFEINSDDGFVTKIGVGGLVDPAEIPSWAMESGGSPDSGTAAPSDGDEDDSEEDGDDDDDEDGGEDGDDGEDGGDDGGDGGDEDGGDDSSDEEDDTDDGDDSGSLPSGPTVISP